MRVKSVSCQGEGVICEGCVCEPMACMCVYVSEN